MANKLQSTLPSQATGHSTASESLTDVRQKGSYSRSNFHNTAMPSLSRKERKRKESHAKKAGKDLSGDAELTSTDPHSPNAEKPIILDDITESIDRADSKDSDGTSDIVHAEHHLEGALSEVGGKVCPQNNEPLAEDVIAEAFSQASLEDIFTSTPPVNSEDDAVEITPNPPSKKKVKRTKKHTHECPQNPSRKLMFGSSKKGKKASKETNHKKKTKCGSRKDFQNRDIHQQGVWVQCDNFRCRKWRYLSSVTDPAKIEQHWICTMHPDSTFNSCDKPEEDYTNLEFIHNKFTEGSIVWAKMKGYPWWPAMVESDPDTGCFMEHEGVETEVTSYHCVFLDKTVSRFWIPAIFVKAFEADGNPPGSLTWKKRDYTKQVMPAKERALDALNLPLEERIERYGFGKTFKGVWREKKSRENCQDEASVEEANLEIDADDVLGDMLSSEDMEELMNETEGLMAEAEEAVQEMDEEENILGKATGEEIRKIKHSRKRKLSKCDEPKVKKKKHKKKKSKHEKSKKIQAVEKESRKRAGGESALKDEGMQAGNMDNVQDDKNLSCKSEEKEGLEVLNREKKIESDNEFEEKHVVPREEFSDRAEIDQTEMKGRKDEESCDAAADDGDLGKSKMKEDKEDDDCKDIVGMEEGDEGRPVPSKEKTDIDGSDNNLGGETELEEKDLNDAENVTEDVKGKGKKDRKTTKAEREEKRKERELKKQCALEEKERKMKEREIKKLKKEKEKQEKEEKKKEREMKKRQALEEKERKRKARIEKAEKKAKKMNKSTEPSGGETQGDNSEKIPVKATGDASDGADTKAKKPKFSVPKGKSKALVPPSEKPNTAIPTDQMAKAHPPQISLVEDEDKDEKKGDGDGVVAVNVSSLTEDEGSKNVEGNSDKENAYLVTDEKVKDSKIAPKLKKKKFSVKRKEVSSDSVVKDEGRNGSQKIRQESVPLTTANGLDSHEGKISGKVDSENESLMMSSKDITENPPIDNPVPTTCNVLENNGNHDCEDTSKASREFDKVNKNHKVQGVDWSWPTKQDEEANASDNDDVLDLEWSEAPEMAGKKSLVTSVNEEDSDPFEVVEE